MNSIPGHELSKSEIQVARIQALVIDKAKCLGVETGFVKVSTFCLPFVCICC